MKYILIATSILFSTVANAQQPLQPVQPSEFVLKVSPDELNLISDGLQTQPFGKVSPLMVKLRQQIMDQQQPKPPGPEIKPEVKPEEPK